MFARTCSYFLWLFFLLLPASALASSTILIYGDSLSAGYGIETGQEWASLLKKRLQNTKYDYEVINRSISGETTAGGLERLPAVLDETKPAILLLALGANDGLRGLSMKTMNDNLQQMITLASQRNISVLLAGMQLPTNYGPDFTERFHQQYVQLANSNSIYFLPFLLDGLGDNIDMFQPDGIHPLAGAQARIMDNIWQILEPLLARNRK